MKKKLLALLVVLAMVLSIVPAVHAEGSTMAVTVTPSASTANVGDVIDYTVYATGEGVTALQFELRFPAGLEYVAGTAAVPTTLKSYLGWAATDWTESSMMWTGYNDLPSVFGEGTVILTFSAKVTAEGTFEPELFELLPFDENYEEFPPELTVGKVTVGGAEEPTTTESEPAVVGSVMDVTVKASATEVAVGDTVDYTVYAVGQGVTALQFELRFPAGLEYVAGTAAVPSTLKSYLGWAATDWTESSMMWTGYNDLPSVFGEGTVILTFSAKVTAEGTFQPELFELLPFDENYEEFVSGLTVDAVTAAGAAECEHSFTSYTSNNDATCTEDGTETAKCDKCDETDTRTAVGSALGHDMGQFLPDGNATCLEDGTKTAVCSRCDKSETVADEGSALGHIDENADKTCDRCGADLSCKHSFTNYEYNNDATCTANGTETAKCDKCEETDTREAANTKKEHSFTDYISNNDATCTANGTETAKCDNCDETDTRVDADSAKGHDLKKVEATVTCTEAGNIAYYECGNCGELFADATGSVPTDKEAVKSDALGHIDADGDKACDRCGYTEPTVPSEPETTLPEGSFMNITVKASKTEAEIGDTINYTVYAFGNDVTALQFELRFPAGLEYVANSAVIPEGLKAYLGWAATDWTESSMMWTGYNDLGSLFEDGTVIMTFSATVTGEGVLEPELFELLPFDLDYNEFPADLTVDKVVVGNVEPTEPSTEPTEPSTEPTEPSTEPTEPSTEPTEPSTEPTEPSTEPTEPSTEPTEPSTEPTEPSTEPTEPSTEGTEPTTKPTEPTTKPGAGGEEIPKTDNDNMVLNYFAVMMVAAFAVLFTVLLGKKKYMA